MRVGLSGILVLLLAMAASPARAAHSDEPVGPATETPASDLEPHPVVSANATWAGGMVVICLGLFGAAWVIGLIVDATRHEDLAPEPHADAHAGADPHAHH